VYVWVFVCVCECVRVRVQVRVRVCVRAVQALVCIQIQYTCNKDLYLCIYISSHECATKKPGMSANEPDGKKREKERESVCLCLCLCVGVCVCVWCGRLSAGKCNICATKTNVCATDLYMCNNNNQRMSANGPLECMCVHVSVHV